MQLRPSQACKRRILHQACIDDSLQTVRLLITTAFGGYEDICSFIVRAGPTMSHRIARLFRKQFDLTNVDYAYIFLQVCNSYLLSTVESFVENFHIGEDVARSYTCRAFVNACFRNLPLAKWLCVTYGITADGLRTVQDKLSACRLPDDQELRLWIRELGAQMRNQMGPGRVTVTVRKKKTQQIADP
jgi:hypothetical protein